MYYSIYYSINVTIYVKQICNANISINLLYCIIYNNTGIDYGTQYRSAIFYYNDIQKELAIKTYKLYEKLINKEITTIILNGNDINNKFYYAEDYHQQYFHKNPSQLKDCSMQGIGVECPVGKIQDFQLEL